MEFCFNTWVQANKQVEPIEITQHYKIEVLVFLIHILPWLVQLFFEDQYMILQISFSQLKHPFESEPQTQQRQRLASTAEENLSLRKNYLFIIENVSRVMKDDLKVKNFEEIGLIYVFHLACIHKLAEQS